MLVVGDVADDPLALPRVGPQPLGLAAAVVADDGVGGGQDGLRRAVVLLEQDRGGVGEVLLEVHDVADVGAPEGVDGLVGVTDHHQLARLDPRLRALLLQRMRSRGLAAQLLDQAVLRMVGVLVLVDEHVAEPAAVVLPHVGEGLQQVHRGHDQVVEVERVGLAQAALVVAERLGVGLLEGVARLLGGVLGIAQLVLLVGDPVEHGVGLVLLRVELEVAQHQRHQPLGVGRVVDREVGLEADPVDLLAEDPDAGGVEGRDPHDPGPLADEGLDALLHLGRGLVGEGDRQDRARVRLALVDQPGDATRQDPGLARARAGDHQQRGAGVRHGGPLGLVEPVEERVVAVLEEGLVGRCVKGAHVAPSLCAGCDSRSGPVGVGQACAGDQKTATAMLATVSASRPSRGPAGCSACAC